MKTSYFAKSLNNFNAVSIARRAPLWYNGREFKKLAPSYEILNKYKKDKDEVYYTEHYKKEVLDKLDPAEIYKELGENAVLLCYETPQKFCHRHLVAEWLEKNLGIVIEEIK